MAMVCMLLVTSVSTTNAADKMSPKYLKIELSWEHFGCANMEMVSLSEEGYELSKTSYVLWRGR